MSIFYNMAIPFKTSTIKLESQTISEQLRSTRQEKNLKLKDVAKYLKIDYKYLEALEKANFEKLPIGAYGKNFLREYAIFLKLDYKERTIIDNKVKEKNYFSKPILKQKIIFSIPKLAKNIIITTAVAICFFYLGSAVKQIFVPPFLDLESPIENFATNKNTINDEVIIANNGIFNKNINLKKGINIIKVTARKKYGNETTIERQVIVE